MNSTPLRAAFQAFYDAEEVGTVLSSFASLLEAACAKDVEGLILFTALEERVAPSLNFRQKSIFPLLRSAIQRREALVATMTSNSSNETSEVVVSGAGPCGLRAAIESALCGMKVTCIEKRDNFSRVNMLTMFPQTNADLLSLGLKYFYPMHPVMGDPLFALGTRQIQLIYLKAAIMLGVRVIYCASLHSLLPPACPGDRWQALISQSGAPRAGAGSQTMKNTKDQVQNALDFKQNKVQRSGYEATSKCNAVEVTAVDAEFVSGAPVAPGEEVARLSFDGLLVAEGEWSTATRALGFNKTIDKFGQALGMVLNLQYDASSKTEKACKPMVESLTDVVGDGSVIAALWPQGIAMENLGYLKGETHYIAASISKASLLSAGALRSADAQGGLLCAENLDMDKLRALGRTIASAVGIPASVAWAEHNPVQLFDYSSRSRCLVPCKLLSGHLQQGAAAVMECSRAAGKACAPAEALGGRPAMVLPIGDSLLEPFWPQGLGINRGLHTGLNAVFTLLAKQHWGLEEAAVEARWGFACVMFGWWTWAYLADSAGWTADPMSRFAPHVLFHTKQMVLAGDGGSKKYSKDEDLPQRVASSSVTVTKMAVR